MVVKYTQSKHCKRKVLWLVSDVRASFGGMYAAIGRGICAEQNVENTSRPSQGNEDLPANGGKGGNQVWGQCFAQTGK